MSKDKFSKRIDALFRREAWAEARALLEKELAKAPDNHWLLTQLAVTLYEQRKYAAALPMLEASRQIVPDCPLTLWNLAGALAALGRDAEAVPLYTALIGSKVSATADPCWESKDWAEALKTDCVYRLGVCFRRLRRAPQAEQCFRQYVNLLLLGIDGTYGIADALRQVRELHGATGNGGAEKELRKVLRQTANH